MSGKKSGRGVPSSCRPRVPINVPVSGLSDAALVVLASQSAPRHGLQDFFHNSLDSKSNNVALEVNAVDLPVDKLTNPVLGSLDFSTGDPLSMRLASLGRDAQPECTTLGRSQPSRVFTSTLGHDLSFMLSLIKG